MGEVWRKNEIRKDEEKLLRIKRRRSLKKGGRGRGMNLRRR
jgi:hypothetical protein